MFKDMEKKLWQLSQYRRRDTIISKQTYHNDIASNALNHWLHHIHKTNIIALSVVLTE